MLCEPVQKYLDMAEQHVFDCNWKDVITEIDLAFNVAWEARKFNGSDDELMEVIFDNYDYTPQSELESLITISNLSVYRDILTVRELKNVTEFLSAFVEYMNSLDTDSVLHTINHSLRKGTTMYDLFNGYSNKNYEVTKKEGISEGESTKINGLAYTRFGDNLVSEGSIFSYQVDTGDEGFAGWNPTEDVFMLQKQKIETVIKRSSFFN